MSITPHAAARNQDILDTFESVGGAYVWEEVFTVSSIEIPLMDAQIEPLCGLVGVQQVALHARHLSAAVLRRVASISGLQSLVLAGSRLSAQELEVLRGLCSEVVVLEDKA